MASDGIKTIEGLVANVEYYTNQIEAACKRQIEEDTTLDRVNTDAGTIRFDTIGAIVGACAWIRVHAWNVRENAKAALAAGKKLEIFEPEEE